MLSLKKKKWLEALWLPPTLIILIMIPSPMQTLGAGQAQYKEREKGEQELCVLFSSRLPSCETSGGSVPGDWLCPSEQSNSPQLAGVSAAVSIPLAPARGRVEIKVRL